MAKDINEYLVLNKEEQILVNKLNKNLSLLSKKTIQYFQQAKIISSDMIKDAFICEKDYLKINQETIMLLSNWKKSVNDFKTKYQQSYQDLTNENSKSFFQFDEVVNENLEIVLNTIDNLGKLYLKKDKIKVLNQLRELFALREKGYSKNLELTFEKYLDSLTILEQILEDKQLIKIKTNYNDVKLLSEFDKLEKKWKVFDNKKLLGATTTLFLTMTIIIITTICILVI